MIENKVDRMITAYEYLRSIGRAHKQQDIAEKMATDKSNVSRAMKGDKKYLTDRFLHRFNRAFDNIFNEDWLLTGEGEMLNNANPKPKYNEATLLNQNYIINVPLVNQYAQAGYLCGYQDAAYIATLPTMPFIIDHEAKGNYVAFEVKGDSMNDGTEESYLEGDRLLCREIAPYLWVDSKLHFRKWDFVIVHEDGIIVKRIIDHDVENHTITIHSLNNMYPDRVIDLCDVKQIFNVIELQRPRRR